MRSSGTAIIRFLVGFLNIILGILFIGLGVIGVLLRVNKDFLIKFTNSLSEEFLNGVQKEYEQEIANFILENDVQTSTYFILVGFLVGFVCMMGFVAACCSCSKLMLIHAVILVTAVVAQITVVGVVFGVPGLYLTVIDTSLENGLKKYDPTTEEGKAPTYLWNVVMAAENEICCGMDGAVDFRDSPYYPKCPSFCCNKKESCTCAEAIILDPPVQGCRQKVEKYSKIYMQKVLIILICVIIAQVILAILTYASLKYKTASPI